MKRNHEGVPTTMLRSKLVEASWPVHIMHGHALVSIYSREPGSGDLGFLDLGSLGVSEGNFEVLRPRIVENSQESGIQGLQRRELFEILHCDQFSATDA